jgi:hypothetical protein
LLIAANACAPTVARHLHFCHRKVFDQCKNRTARNALKIDVSTKIVACKNVRDSSKWFARSILHFLGSMDSRRTFVNGEEEQKTSEEGSQG